MITTTLETLAKRAVLAAKQVGNVSYCVEDLNRLILVLESQMIRASRKPEINPKVTSKKDAKQYYVSLSRDLTAACKRNPRRWSCGVILDGTKLSNRYHIEPFSYANTNLNEGKNLAVKSLTAYEDGTCKLVLVGWPAISIGATMYHQLAEMIEYQSPQFNESHKLQHTGRGSRKVNGTYIKEKYLYNVKHGGIRLTNDELGSVGVALAKHTAMNEMEERIWLPSKESRVDIKGCILGIIISKSILEDPDYADEIDEIFETTELVAGKNFRILRY